MRYLIIIACMMFVIGCAGLHKPVDPAPNPGPTQEELLEQQQIKAVHNFWEQESQTLSLFFFNQTGIIIDFKLTNIHFFNNYDLGMLEIEMSHDKDVVNCYMVIVPVGNGEWTYQTLIVRAPQVLPEEDMKL